MGYADYDFFSDAPGRPHVNQKKPENVTKPEQHKATADSKGEALPAISYCALTAQGAINLTKGRKDWEFYDTIVIPTIDIRYWEAVFKMIVEKAKEKKNEITFKGKINKDAEQILFDLGYNVWHLVNPQGDMFLNSAIDKIVEKPYVKIIWSSKAR